MPPESSHRETLVNANLRLAYSFARRAHRRDMGPLDVEDLEQEAVMGLMAAASLYDVETHPDVPFSAFARDYIIRYISDAVGRWRRIRLDPILSDIADHRTDPRADRLALEVWDMLQHVPRRVQPLLIRRYGLDGGPAMGLIQLAGHFALPVRTVGRLLEQGREVIRQECRLRGYSFERWAEAIAGKIA